MTENHSLLIKQTHVRRSELKARPYSPLGLYPSPAMTCLLCLSLSPLLLSPNPIIITLPLLSPFHLPSPSPSSSCPSSVAIFPPLPYPALYLPSTSIPLPPSSELFSLPVRIFHSHSPCLSPAFAPKTLPLYYHCSFPELSRLPSASSLCKIILVSLSQYNQCSFLQSA